MRGDRGLGGEIEGGIKGEVRGRGRVLEGVGNGENEGRESW